MLKQTTEMTSLQRQFQEVNTTLMSIVEKLTLTSNPMVSTAIQDITRVSQSIRSMEQNVNDQFKLRRSEVTALMELGSVINSSLGKERVLEEVMDSVISLMRAERGFLMLRDPSGELSVRIARGIAQVDLDEEEFVVSRTVVRRVAETGQPVLTTNAQEDPRFTGQLSIAAYHLRSILCVPLKLKKELARL